jgi:UDP-N-acetylmuramyl tripeptide synthase
MLVVRVWLRRRPRCRQAAVDGRELPSGWADRVIVTDDNPRTEDPQRIVATFRPGCVIPKRRR